MKTFSNFAVSFTIISILSGCLTLFGFAMNVGGPAVMTLGWLFVGFFVILVSLGMAEVASSYPTAGGLYYWAAKLAPESGRNPAAWSWFVGWFNLVGQVAVTAGIDFGLALFTTAFLNLAFGVTVTPTVTIAVYGVMLVLHGLLNTFGISLVKLLNDVSVWWHVVGVTLIVIVCVLLNQHTRTDLGTVFSTTVNNTGFDASQGLGLAFLGIPLYVALIGLLNAQYTLTGYDASAHMSEETHDADTSAPRGIVFSVVISVIFGFILLVAMNVGITPEKIFAGDRRDDGRRLHPRPPVADRRAAGPDLDRRRRPVARDHRPARRHRRPVLLRHVVRDRQLPDDLRVLARRRRPGQPLLAPDQQADTDADQLDLAGSRRRVHPGLAVPLQPDRVRRHHVDRGHRAVRRLHRARLPAPAGREQVRQRPLEPRSLEPADRDRRDDLGRLHLHPVHAAADVPDHGQQLQLHAAGVPVVLGGAAIWYAVSAKNWFKGPKVQGTAEELREIERDLEVI